MAGVPWEPVPGSGPIGLKTHIRIPTGEPPSQETQVTIREFKPRSFYIRGQGEDHPLRKYGTQVGCKGCDAWITGSKAIQHDKSCRDRIWEAMVLNNDPRVIKEYEKQLRQGMDPGGGGPTDQGGENQSGQSGSIPENLKEKGEEMSDGEKDWLGSRKEMDTQEESDAESERPDEEMAEGW